MGHQQPHHQWEERPGELGLACGPDKIFFFVLGLKRFATVKWVYVVLMKKTNCISSLQ